MTLPLENLNAPDDTGETFLQISHHEHQSGDLNPDRHKFIENNKASKTNIISKETQVPKLRIKMIHFFEDLDHLDPVLSTCGFASASHPWHAQL